MPSPARPPRNHRHPRLTHRNRPVAPSPTHHHRPPARTLALASITHRPIINRRLTPTPSPSSRIVIIIIAYPSSPITWHLHRPSVIARLRIAPGRHRAPTRPSPASRISTLDHRTCRPSSSRHHHRHRAHHHHRHRHRIAWPSSHPINPAHRPGRAPASASPPARLPIATHRSNPPARPPARIASPARRHLPITYRRASST